VKGPDAFRAFYFLRRGLGYQNRKALKKGIQTFIDFASLLCENPRKRPTLRRIGEGDQSRRSLRAGDF
jgi:hypothetical protein